MRYQRQSQTGAVALLLLVGVAVGSGAAHAKNPTKTAEGPPKLYQQVIDCQKVAEPAARLACFDQQVAELDKATQRQDIVVADRDEVRRTRRGLFGFSVPIGRLLGIGGNDDPDEVKKIDTTITGVRHTADGWEITFAEGGAWDQVDMRNFVMSPKVGQKATISRAALGSYVISVDGQSGIKFRRVK